MNFRSHSYESPHLLKRRITIVLLIIFMLQTHSRVFGGRLQMLKPNRIELLYGFQQQCFSWSIAGNLSGQNPNLLSQLRWYNLKGAMLEVTSTWEIFPKWELTIPIKTVFFLTGSVVDTDYEQNNKESVVFCAKASSSGSYEYNFSPYFGTNVHINPYLRLRLNLNYLFLINHYLLKDTKEKLDSSYSVKWSGMGASLGLCYYFNQRTSVVSTLSYLRLNYYATANWNLIEAFKHPVSFMHKAVGEAYTCQIKAVFDINTHYSFVLKLDCNQFVTGKGVDELFKANGTAVRTMLNGVVLKNNNIAVGIILFI